jgi:uncharacterized phage infection (PIP) family protein YhgE
MLSALLLPTISFFVIFGFVVYFIYLIDKRPEHIVKSAPSLLVTIGITFTFLGICLAFLNFNAQNIESELPNLINHIKFAFWGSFFGVLGAVFIKCWTTIFSTKYDYEDITIEELMHKQNDGFNSIKTCLDQNNKILASFSTTLCSDHEYSLNSQISKFMTQHENHSRNIAILVENIDDYIKEFTKGSNENPWLSESKKRHEQTLDSLEALRTTMSNFYDQQMRKNTQVFTDAVSKTIESFNKEMTKQLGANFHEFNQGLGAMLKWQDNYKSQIDSWIEQETFRQKNIEKITKSLSDSSDVIDKTANNLDKIGEANIGLLNTSESLNQALMAIISSQEQLKTGILQTAEAISKTLAELPSIKMILEDHTKTMEAIPKTHVTLLTELAQQQNGHFSKLNKEISDQIKSFMKNVAADIAQHDFPSIQRLASQHLSQLEQIAKAQQTHLDNITTKQSEQLLDITTKICKTQEEQISKLIKTILTDVQEMVGDFSKNINQMSQQIGSSQAQLEQELDNSLNSLGRNLASLSRRFVDDYEPLTEQLRKVVQLAETIKGHR